jgi:cytochrome c553
VLFVVLFVEFVRVNVNGPLSPQSIALIVLAFLFILVSMYPISPRFAIMSLTAIDLHQPDDELFICYACHGDKTESEVSPGSPGGQATHKRRSSLAALSPSNIRRRAFSLPQADLSETGRAICARYLDACKNQNFNISRAVILTTPGDIREEVCAYAEENEIDTMVVGKRERSGFQRLFSQSFSKYMLTNALCDVLLVK